MRTSSVVIGSLFGAILAAALAPPLFVSVPARYVNNWYYMTHEGALFGLGAALVLPVIAGFLAAALHPEEPIRSGTGAGLVTAALGAVGMAMPSAVVMSGGTMLELVASGRATAERLQEAAGDALLALAWLPSTLAIAMACSGAGLGAIGGVVFDLWRGTPSARPGRDVHRSPVPLVVLWSAPLAAGVGLYAMAGADQTRVALQVEPGWWATTQLSTPTLAMGLTFSALIGWAMRDAVLSYRKAARATAALWVMLALGAPVVVLVELIALFPSALLSPWPWLSSLVVCLVALVSPILAARSDAVLDTEPRGFSAVFGDAVQIGLLSVAQASMIGGSAAVGAWLLVGPYTAALIDGAGSVSDTPEALVARMFYAHWAAVGGAVVLGLGWMVLGTPLWLVGRASAARRD